MPRGIDTFDLSSKMVNVFITSKISPAPLSSCAQGTVAAVDGGCREPYRNKPCRCILLLPSFSLTIGVSPPPCACSWFLPMAWYESLCRWRHSGLSQKQSVGGTFGSARGSILGLAETLEMFSQEDQGRSYRVTKKEGNGKGEPPSEAGSQIHPERQ